MSRSDSRIGIAETASICEMGLLAGVVTIRDVVAWADSVIDSSEVAPDWAIPLSLAAKRHPLDVCSLLRQVPGNRDGVSIWRDYCGRILRAVEDGEMTAIDAATRCLPPASAPEGQSEEVLVLEPDRLFDISLALSCSQGSMLNHGAEAMLLPYLRDMATSKTTT